MKFSPGKKSESASPILAGDSLRTADSSHEVRGHKVRCNKVTRSRGHEVTRSEVTRSRGHKVTRSEVTRSQGHKVRGHKVTRSLPQD